MKLLLISVLSSFSFYYLTILNNKQNFSIDINDNNFKELLEEIKNYNYV